MNWKRTFYRLLPVLISVVACERKSLDAPAKSFIKFYGGFDTDKGYAAVELPDGGFACMGTKQQSETDLDFYLVRTDASGNTQWEKTYGYAGMDEGKSVEPTPDGGFLLLGNAVTESNTEDLLLIKTDASGNEQWSKTFGRTDQNEKAFALHATHDAGYLLVGNAVHGDKTSDMLVIKVNAQGEKQWEQTYGLTGLSNDLRAVVETPDNNLLWCGSEYRYRDAYASGSSDVRIVLTQPEGGIIWDKTYGEKNTEAGAGVLVTDGGYIVVGTTYSTTGGDADILVTKLFADGSVRWTKQFGGSRDETAYAIQSTREGGYIITGATKSIGEGGSDIYLLKISREGDQEWEAAFGGKLDDTGINARQTADGGYFVFGTITFENNLMMSLIKTNNRGQLIGN